MAHYIPRIISTDKQLFQCSECGSMYKHRFNEVCKYCGSTSFDTLVCDSEFVRMEDFSNL